MKYRRSGIVGLAAAMFLAIAGSGSVLAADPPVDVVTDGVVTVHWVDPVDGPMAGASIQISYYHAGDATRGALPASATDPAGNAQIGGVPLAAEGSAPVLLNVRGERSTRTTDAAGCTRVESWLAELDGVASNGTVEVSLGASSKSVDMTCPEPEPAIDVPPGLIDLPTGGVAGATGRPQQTLPPTDVVAAGARDGTETANLLALLVALGAGAAALPLRACTRRRATAPLGPRNRA
jgi:hypothetical protein